MLPRSLPAMGIAEKLHSWLLGMAEGLCMTAPHLQQPKCEEQALWTNVCRQGFTNGKGDSVTVWKRHGSKCERLGLWFVKQELCGMYMSFTGVVVCGLRSSVSFSCLLSLFFFPLVERVRRMSWWCAHIELCVKFLSKAGRLWLPMAGFPLHRSRIERWHSS